MEKINVEGLDEIIYKGVCDNGLEVYVWPKDNAQMTYMTLTVKYGSNHTDFKIDGKKYTVPNGTAHFLEHMKFNEDANTTAHDFFQQLGAETNAFTTFLYTSYLVYTVDHFDECLNHLLDFVQKPYFVKKQMQKEKGIIIEEANMGLDSVGSKINFGINKAIFSNSNYRNEITGLPGDIKKITLDDLKTVYNGFYTPNNMFLIVTGNVNPDKVFALVEKNQKNKKLKNPSTREIIIPKEPSSVCKQRIIVEDTINTPLGHYVLKMPRKIFKRYSDPEIRNYLDLILGMSFDSTSVFKYDLISASLVTSLYSRYKMCDDYIVIIIGFESEYPEQIIKRIKKYLNHLPINEDAFNRKKKTMIANSILCFEDVEEVNSLIQISLIYNNRFVSELVGILKKLNYECVIDVASKLDFKNNTTYILIPKKHE
jgi:predicted Zn-dependent peptidase